MRKHEATKFEQPLEGEGSYSATRDTTTASAAPSKAAATSSAPNAARRAPEALNVKYTSAARSTQSVTPRIA